jgi:hypothetical protein
MEEGLLEIDPHTPSVMYEYLQIFTAPETSPEAKKLPARLKSTVTTTSSWLRIHCIAALRGSQIRTWLSSEQAPEATLYHQARVDAVEGM